MEPVSWGSSRTTTPFRGFHGCRLETVCVSPANQAREREGHTETNRQMREREGERAKERARERESERERVREIDGDGEMNR